MPFTIRDTRVQAKSMLCQSEASGTTFIDLLFVVEAYVVIEGDEKGMWRTFCMGKEPITFHNHADARAWMLGRKLGFQVEAAA